MLSYGLIDRIEKQLSSASDGSSSDSDSISWKSDNSNEESDFGNSTIDQNNVPAHCSKTSATSQQVLNETPNNDACTVPLLLKDYEGSLLRVEEMSLKYLSETDVPALTLLRNMGHFHVSGLLSIYKRTFPSITEQVVLLTSLLDFVSCCSQPGYLLQTYESLKSPVRMEQHLLKLKKGLNDLLYSPNAHKLSLPQLRSLKKLIDAAVNRLPVHLRFGFPFVQSNLGRKIASLEFEERERSSFPMYDFGLEDDFQQTSAKKVSTKKTAIKNTPSSAHFTPSQGKLENKASKPSPSKTIGLWLKKGQENRPQKRSSPPWSSPLKYTTDSKSHSSYEKTRTPTIAVGNALCESLYVKRKINMSFEDYDSSSDDSLPEIKFSSPKKPKLMPTETLYHKAHGSQNKATKKTLKVSNVSSSEPVAVQCSSVSPRGSPWKVSPLKSEMSNFKDTIPLGTAGSIEKPILQKSVTPSAKEKRSSTILDWLRRYPSNQQSSV